MPLRLLGRSTSAVQFLSFATDAVAENNWRRFSGTCYRLGCAGIEYGSTCPDRWGGRMSTFSHTLPDARTHVRSDVPRENVCTAQYR